MDNNNVNMSGISNNNMNNPKIPNNASNAQSMNNANNQNKANTVQPVSAPSVAPPSVSGPTVVPPSVGNNNFNFNEEDGKILMPNIPQPINNTPTPSIEVAPQSNVVPQSTDVPNPQPEVNVDNNSNDAGVMENVKMEKVEIEYTPPSKFKTVLMVFMFLIILGTIVFMPQITMLIEKMKEKPEPEISSTEIQTGTLTCSFESNNDKFDLIHSGDFNFTNRSLKSLNYSLITKGDRVQDSTELDTMYNNCKSLSTELNNKSLGVKVNCDLYDGTLKIDESINYSDFVTKDANALFDKYSIELADFEANQDIGDIERELKSSNYVCTMESKGE